MKKIVLTLVVALATVCVLAQEKERGGRRGPGERRAHMRQGGHGPMMMPGNGAWAMRLVADKAALEKLGVTDEAQCAKILEAVKPLKEQSDQMEQKMRGAMHERMQLQRAFLKDKGADAQALIAKIKETANLRAEHEVLSVKVLAVLRDNLTPEQMANVRPFGPRPGGFGGERRGPRGDGERPRRRPAADK